jgi:transposase
MAWISSPNPARASKCFYLFDQPSARLGVSAHSSKDEKQSAELIEANSEIQRLRPQMRRLEVEWDPLKKGARYFAREPE